MKMNIPESLRYTDQHEWIKVDGQIGTIGVTDFAQNSLSDMTYVELPQAGKVVKQGDELAAIESCKAAASIYAPVAATVVEVNEELELDPGLINTDPYGKGWICKLKIEDDSQLSELLSAEQYKPLCEEQT
jgi:glycine cleavage system H protein